MGVRQSQIAEGQVDMGKGCADEERRQHEQGAGDDAAPGPVRQPADVDGMQTRAAQNDG